MSVSPNTDTIGQGASRQFTASVTGTSNQGVAWSVSGAPGSGTIDATGLYIAPQLPPSPATVTISATSQADSTRQGTATVTVQATDPLGTAQGAPLPSCPPASGGVPGGTCYQLNISCDGVQDFSAYLKVNTPQGTAGGTVIFVIGRGGAGLYDSDFIFGNVAVGNVLAAGFTTVQVSFGPPFDSATPDGWLTGPGGVRHLACRYATVAQWVHDNIHAGGATKPMCATGNSGGAGAVAYAVSHYGLDKIFSMLELTSGPPMSQIDEACVPTGACKSVQTDCNGVIQTLDLCYDSSEAEIIDPAYSRPICSEAVNGGAANTDLFVSDSLMSGPAQKFSFPKTNVHLLFGGADKSSAVPQGVTWGAAVKGATSNCVSTAPHEIPNDMNGATTIAQDIIKLCAVQP